MKHPSSLLFASAFFVVAGCSGGTAADKVAVAGQPVVAALKSNVLFAGFDNPVAVAVPGLSCSGVKVTCDNGEVKGNGCQWTIRPKSIGMATITVRDSANGSQALATSVFRVQEAPAPFAAIAGRSLNEGTIDRQTLLSTTGVMLKLADFNFDVLFRLERFELSVLGQGRPVQHHAAPSAKFTEEMKKAFPALKPGDGLLIHGIRATGPTGELRIADLYLIVQ